VRERENRDLTVKDNEQHNVAPRKISIAAVAALIVTQAHRHVVLHFVGLDASGSKINHRNTSNFDGPHSAAPGVVTLCGSATLHHDARNRPASARIKRFMASSFTVRKRLPPPKSPPPPCPPLCPPPPWAGAISAPIHTPELNVLKPKWCN
jgi:hypothetical protein